MRFIWHLFFTLIGVRQIEGRSVWNDNNGEVREKHIINAEDVALNLSQKRIESIQLAPKADMNHGQKKSLDKPINERPKAGYTSPRAKSGMGLG